MKILSTEKITVGDKEYTLFINRKGIVSWENITKLTKKATEIENKYKEVSKNLNSDKPIKVEDNDNPFDYAGSDEIEELEKDEAVLREIYIKFYWIALYENHKLSLSDTEKLFEDAENEYGLEQLVLLANQMVEDANRDMYGKKELKKLTALRPTK